MALETFQEVLTRHIGDRPYAQIAAAAGMDGSAVYRLAHWNKRQPTPKTLFELSRTLKLNKLDGIEFYLSAGMAHPDLRLLDPFVKVLAQESFLFSDQSLPKSEKKGFEEDVEELVCDFEWARTEAPELLPPPISYHSILKEHIRISGLSNRIVSLAVNLNESYLSSAMKRKIVPTRITLASFSKALYLSPLESFRLTLASGLAPQQLIDSNCYLPTILKTTTLLLDNNLTIESRDRFARIVILKARNWQEE